MNRLICSLIGIVSIAICGVAAAQGNSEECKTAFNQSSAKKSCHAHIDSFKIEGDRCLISVSCNHREFSTYTAATHAEQIHSTTGENKDYWFLADVIKLVNCDGALKVDSCNRQGTGATTAPPPPPPPPTLCQSSWAKSSASQSCQATVKHENDKCEIAAKCSLPKPHGGYTYGTTSWTPADTSKLANCTGVLKVNNCSN